MVEPVLEKLEQFIRQKGLRRTPQRDAIVSLAFENGEHFTSEELYQRVRKNNVNASRATVYRTISLMLEAGLLHEIDLGGDQTTYDPNFVDKPSHNHLVCIDCGKVIEFEDDHVDLLNDCMTRRLGFRPVRQTIKLEACCEQLRLKGHCPNLLQARLNSKRLPARKR